MCLQYTIVHDIMEPFLTLLDPIQLGIDPDQFVVSER